jgi:Flp pilus assembly secretin CpaC
MLRTLFVAALVLGIGLGTAIAQEKPQKKRETTRTRTVEKSTERPSAVRPLPPTGAETAAGAERAADVRAPMVSVQMVMAELIPEAAKRERTSPPSSGPAAGAAISAIDLSAPDEKLREELRKLGVQGRVDVLYRISLTTADQQTAKFQVSHRLPRIVGMTLTQFGQTNNIDMLNTGTTVEIQPRVAGEIVSLTVSFEDSRLGPAEEGVPIAVSAKGETTRAAPIHNFNLRTAVNVPSGQTIVLSGLVSEDGPRKRQRMVLLCPRIIVLSASEAGRPSR